MIEALRFGRRPLEAEDGPPYVPRRLGAPCSMQTLLELRMQRFVEFTFAVQALFTFLRDLARWIRGLRLIESSPRPGLIPSSVQYG